MINIKGYKGKYKACEDGRIWAEPSAKRPDGCYLKPWLIGHGYETVSLYKNGKGKKFLVHRLVAKAFIDNPEKAPEINHKDGNRLNNRIENLEWVSSKENKSHARKIGLYKNLGKNPARGEKNGLAKLSKENVQEIRKRIETGERQNILASEFGVGTSAINSIVQFKTWKHI